MTESGELTEPTQTDAEEQKPRGGYKLDKQIGFLLRRAQQRHLSIFSTYVVEGLTTQQFTVLVKINEMSGGISQNALGRQTAMDQSTVNGVVQRLIKHGLVRKEKSPDDKRKILLNLTPDGERVLSRMLPVARDITRLTLAPLSTKDQAVLIKLLRQIT